MQRWEHYLLLSRRPSKPARSQREERRREEKAEGSDAQPEAKQEEKPEQKKEELETYSKDVQRRIAKLTKKWREAERQKDEALSFARNQKDQDEYSNISFRVTNFKIFNSNNYENVDSHE